MRRRSGPQRGCDPRSRSDIEQDCEKVEEPEIAAGRAVPKDGIIAKDMANRFSHLSIMP